jgi:PAS domain S-box-containing protein
VTESKRKANLFGVPRKYQAVFEQSPVAIFVTDEALTITSANRAAADLLVSTDSEIKAMHIEKLFPERRREAMLESLRGLGGDQRSRTFREYCIPFLGEPFEAKINAAALGGIEDGLKGCVITIEKLDE